MELNAPIKRKKKNLLYSTGNSTQYTVMAYMRKQSKKEWINDLKDRMVEITATEQNAEKEKE